MTSKVAMKSFAGTNDYFTVDAMTEAKFKYKLHLACYSKRNVNFRPAMTELSISYITYSLVMPKVCKQGLYFV